MIESTINQREMTNFAAYARTETAANSAFRTSIDTTEFENEINLRKKASYADYKNTISSELESMRPQLVAPAFGISSNHALSIDELFNQFGGVGVNKGIPIAELRLILQSIKAQSDKRWQVFENELNNLISAQDRLDKALATLEELKANPDTPQDVFDQAKREAEMAFKNIAPTLEKLNESISALPPSATARRLQSLMDAAPVISFLDQLLFRMQEAQEEFMLNIPKEEFKMYETAQKATYDSLVAASQKIKETRDQQGILFEVVKWVTLAVTTAFTFASGGSLSFLLGVVSAAFVAVDVAADGIISEKMLNPIMENTLGKALEELIPLLTDALVDAGCPEGAATAISAVIIMIGLAVATYAVGRVASSVVGKIAEREAVKAAMLKIEAWLGESETLAWIKGADEAIIKLVAGTMENYLHRMSQAQVGLMVFSTAAESSIQIAMGYIQKYMKDFEAITAMLNNRGDVIAGQIDKASERVVTNIQNRDEKYRLRFELINSDKNAVLGSLGMAV